MWRLFALALLSPLCALAGTDVPPSVLSVRSGGYWEAAGESGVYRVVVVNAGFEHVTSRVFVEWLRGPRSGDESPVIVAVVEPDLPFGREVASLDVELQPLSRGRTRVIIRGVVAAQPKRNVRAVFVATNPGQISR